MKGDEGLALVGLELGRDHVVQVPQLGDIGSCIAPVAVSAAGVGFHQAIADGFHLLNGPQGIQPDVGIDRPMVMAVVVVVVVVLLVMR